MEWIRRSRIKQTVLVLILAVAVSAAPVFAETGTRTDGAASQKTSAEVTAAEESTESGDQGKDRKERTQKEKKKSAPEIIKKGRHYYYRDAKGKIRKTAGFVTVKGKRYYVQKGGMIKTDGEFRVGLKYYRANKRGVIKTGVYKWGKYYYYSDSKGAWRKKEGFITWDDDTYYVQKGGNVVVNGGFTTENTAYIADKKGCVSKVALRGDNNAVVRVARKQVGIMTGVKYWVWYYRTRFVDTDRTPWCGAFVSWVYNKAGLYNKISVAKRYGPLGYVPSYSRFADRYGKWIKKKDARAGDIIMFGRNRHVGIVEGVYGKYIVTIEGNAGPTAAIGCRKPGAVVRKIYRLSDRDIKGVICVMKHKQKNKNRKFSG